MIRRILVVELLGGLGDAVIALPAVHALAAAHPAARVAVATTPAGAELLALDPAITRAWPVAPDDVTAGVGHLLDTWRPDLVVSTTRHSDLPALLERDAARRGTRLVADLWRGPPPDERIDARFVRLLRADGVLPPDVAVAAPRLAVPAARRDTGRRVLGDVLAGVPGAGTPGMGAPAVLVTGAGMAVKQWPGARWAHLAAALARGAHPVLAVADPGGADPGAADPVPGAAVVPELSLPDLAGFFAAVGAAGGVVVGPDTGPMHLAAAAGAVTVGLFGPTAATRYGLAAPGGAGADLQGFPGCPVRRPTAITEQQCWWRARCPFTTGGPLCLAEVGVGDVAAAVHRAFARD